jgi:hypothetical protein
LRQWSKLCSIAVCLIATCRATGQHETPPLTLNCLADGAQLIVRPTLDGGSPTQHFIDVTHAGKSDALTDVGGLEGLVNLRTAEDALQVVRLRTSPSTWRYWAGEPVELEVSTVADARHQPNYGLKPEFPDRSGRNFPSGEYAVVSDLAFRAGNFSRPTVQAEANGYLITRWLYVIDVSRRGSIQRVRESLTKTGRYRRKVLLRRSLPSLPGTKWEIQGDA